MKFAQHFNSQPLFLLIFIITNMLLGFTIVAICMYLMINGQYDSIQARQSADSLLGQYATGGLLYTVMFWYIYVFTKPHLLNKKGN